MSIFDRRVPEGKYSILSVGFPTCRHGLTYVRQNLNPVGSLNKSKMNSNATNKFIKPIYR